MKFYRRRAEKSKLFESYRYSPFYPRVRSVLSGTTISRMGLSLSSLSIYSFLSYHHFVFYIKAFFYTAASRFARGSAEVHLEPSVTPAIIHSGWASGYYHWLTEALPRALVLKDQFPNAIPLLPIDVYSGFLPSLKALGFERVIPYPDGKAAKCDRIVITECPKFFGTTSPILLRRVREEIFRNHGIGAMHASEIVYVSRARARGRRVLNEECIFDLLGRYGGRIVNFEDYSFEDQVKIMSSCKIFVGIHGAGLSNMMFMPPGGVVIELVARRHGLFDYRKIGNSFRHQACYWRLAEAMGHSHDFVLGEASVSRFSRTDMADIHIDLLQLEKKIVSALGNHR